MLALTRLAKLTTGQNVSRPKTLFHDWIKNMALEEFEVFLFEEAENDLERYYLYYLFAAQDKSVAERVTDKIVDAILGLGTMPYRHPKERNGKLSKAGVRRLICENFVVPFLIKEEKKAIYVLRVFHGKMDYGKLL